MIADVTATLSACFSKMWIGSTFLLPTYPGFRKKKQLNRVVLSGLSLVPSIHLTCTKTGVK